VRSVLVYRRAEIPYRLEHVDLATGHRMFFKEFAPPDRTGLLSLREIFVTDDLARTPTLRTIRCRACSSPTAANNSDSPGGVPLDAAAFGGLQLLCGRLPHSPLSGRRARAIRQASLLARNLECADQAQAPTELLGSPPHSAFHHCFQRVPCRGVLFCGNRPTNSGGLEFKQFFLQFLQKKRWLA
jgi:hypothetical protein